MEEPLLPLSTTFEGDGPTPANTPAADTVNTSADTGYQSSPSPSTANILTRLSSLILIASISLWANHEASRGFQVTILNDARGSEAGKKFDLLFVSNDRATRLLLNASTAIEQLLYPDAAAYPKKSVQLVTLRLAPHNLSGTAVAVSPNEDGLPGGFVIQLSPSEVRVPAAAARMAAAVFRGMARVWLWDDAAPQVFLDAMAEHLIIAAGFPEAENRSPQLNLPNVGAADNIGQFLRFCDGRTKDFMPRLNRALRKRSIWSGCLEQLLLSRSLQTTPIESVRLCESVLESAGAAGGVLGTATGPSPSTLRCDAYSCAQ